MNDEDVHWQDYLAGHRMAVDREFADQVRQSDLSRQQWGLVMTAVEFDIEDPEDPESAKLVARTDQLEHVLPAMQQDRGHPAGPVGGGGGTAGESFVERLKSAIGLDAAGGDQTQAMEAEAERLTAAYAKRLQDRLQREGQWEELRKLAIQTGG